MELYESVQVVTFQLGYWYWLEKVMGNMQVMAVVVVGWLLNVPATCECTSGTDLLRQFYVLPH